MIVVPALQIGLGRCRRLGCRGERKLHHVRRALLEPALEQRPQQHLGRRRTGTDRAEQLPLRQFAPHHVQEARLGQAVVAQHRLECLAVELPVGTAECRHGEHRPGAPPGPGVTMRSRCNSWFSAAWAISRCSASPRHIAAHFRSWLLAGRQIAGRLRHFALVGLLELRALDRLAADLGDPGRGADQADHVADAPGDEGEAP